MNSFSKATGVLIFLFCCSTSAQTLVFAVAADEPPLSSEVDGTAIGIIPDITKHLFSLAPNYEVDFVTLPWTRAQISVEKGVADGFVTYPSEQRKRYAFFSRGVANKIDFGYLIFAKDHKRRLELEEAVSFEDLKTFNAYSGHNGPAIRIGWTTLTIMMDH